ncbi:hypothetical protein E2562_013458 [Oryza meyeriana var. granulata]|uniref:Endonuclease/exonuclease/phosphatase domain-containing protein n=1 Tax=Oryza meyeriana var. granulata TaxID=110450 RepID=A0A6G1BW15_9ORYZ|nr:hypothetical protein E2562_013458 [Oryza meyeriana var. granulata]
MPPPPQGASWECGPCARDTPAGSPCGSCGAPPRWASARCTLLNPSSSGACGACAAKRPVEIDADDEDEDDPAWPPPSPRPPCARRKMARDEVEGADAPRPAAKKGNFENNMGKKTFKIMTYNVWIREDIELRRRLDALGDLIQLHSPDLICFQEVTPYMYQILEKSDWWQEYECLLSHQMAMRKSHFCMQMSKLPVRSSGRIPFPNSVMRRELCIATIKTGGMINLALGTSHLESPCPLPPRWDPKYSEERVAQANHSLGILGKFNNAIFCGDMNWDDKVDGPFPLPDGWVDAWVELKPGDNGWTYDTKANAMLSANFKQQKRMDRFVCKLSNFKIDDIEMIGKDAIPGVMYYKEKIVRKELHKMELPVLPSKHFGLVLTITHLDDIS